MVVASLNRFLEGSESASGVISGLSEREVWQIAVCHLAGLMRQLPASAGSAATGEASFEAFTVRLRPAAPDKADIEYLDHSAAFRVEGFSLANRDGPRYLSQMLQLLRFAKNDADTLFYLNSTMRKQLLEGLAADCGTGISFVRYVCANFERLMTVFTT